MEGADVPAAVTSV